MDWIDWGDAPTWAGAAVALIAAFYTCRQAKHAKASAGDAREALATAIRPIFAFGESDARQIEVRVTGQHPALDVVAKVTGEGGREHGQVRADRMPGRVPGTLAGPADLVVPLHDLKIPTALGETVALTVTTRASDYKGLCRWEQRGRINFEVRQHSRRIGPKIEAVKFEPGEPILYSPNTQAK